MKTKLPQSTLSSVALSVFLACTASVSSALAQGTAFTYQGQLNLNGSLANGTYDFKFDSWSASSGGSVIGGPVTNSLVAVSNGLFLTIIDFGSGVFTGTTNWLHIQVRTNGTGAFSSLSPRQQLTPTPYAMYAETASAAGLSGTIPAGNLSLSGINGSGLTSLNASELTTGTVADALLAPDVAFTDANQTFMGANIFTTGTNAGRLTVWGSTGLDTSLFTGLGLQYATGSREGAIMSSFNDGYASLGFFTKQGSGYPVAKQVKIDRYGGVAIDQQNVNNGVLNDGTTNGVGLTFGTGGSGSGEGIASQRTAGPNQYGLDFYTGFRHRMTILNNGNVGIGTTNPGTAFQVNGTVTALALVGDGGGLTNLNASEVGGLAASAFWQTTGNAGTSPGVNFLGTSDDEPLILRANDQMALQLQYSSVSSELTSQSSINLIGGYWNNTIADGLVGGTIAGGGGAARLGVKNYSYPNTVTGSYGTVGGGEGNSAGSYGTVPGGSANVASGSYSFAAGQQAQALNQGAFVWADSESPVFASTANDQFLIRAQGGVGIGTSNPEQGLSVYSGMNLDQAGLNAGVLNNNNTNGYGLSFGIDSGEGIASQRTSGPNQFDLTLFTAFNPRLTILSSGYVGIGMTNPSTLLEVNGTASVDGGTIYLQGPDTGNFAYDGLGWSVGGQPGINDDSGPFLAGYYGGALGSTLPNSVNLSWDYQGNVWVSNNLSTASLTIRGGADLAEPFNISSGGSEVPQGAVVVIDEQNPGHLKLSDSPYDTRVAGVVSGANGINPGIQMHQQGLIEGGKNVALTGRVYVQADASNGAIRPGDMLTTSATPGHAMRVSDHARAAGAILGKAMTGLNEGKGMVLVLVTLQ